MNASQRSPSSSSNLMVLSPNSNTDLNSSQMPVQASQSAFSQFCNLWKTQVSIPVIAYEKLLKILKQHITLKPHLQKREKQLQILFTYNTKLIQTIQKFRQHEKKILDRCNSLTKLYVKTFKKYFQSKSKQFDQSQFKQMHSIFDTFSIQQWKADAKELQLPKVNLKYKQYLYNILKEHYILPSHGLEKLVDNLKPKQNIPYELQKEYQSIFQRLKTQLREYNKLAQTATIQNMFDIYQKKKKLISQIKFFELQQKAIEIQNQQKLIKNTKKKQNKEQLQKQFKTYEDVDESFHQAVKKLHAEVEDVDLLKLKKYLQAQVQHRLKLKKKQLKQRKKFENYHNVLRQQNTELKQEIEQIRQKLNELQKANSEYKAQIQYMSIKTSMSKKNISQNMSIMFQDTSFLGDKGMKKESSRKYQNEIKKLQQTIKNKDKQLKSLTNINKDLDEVQKGLDQMYEKFSSLVTTIKLQPIKKLPISKQVQNAKQAKKSVKFDCKAQQKSVDKILSSIKLKMQQFSQLYEDFSKLTFSLSKTQKNKVTTNKIDHNKSVFQTNNPSILNNSQLGHLNQTQIIQPPKMQTSRQANLSQDSLSRASRASSKKKKGQQSSVYNTYNEYNLKISSPPAHHKLDESSIDEITSLQKITKENKSHKQSNSQQQQQQQHQRQKQQQHKNQHEQQKQPICLPSIDQQSKQQSSKLEKNQHEQNNVKVQLKGSNSLMKYSANFNHNFTIVSHQSANKQILKINENNQIIKLNDIHEIDSFAKINNDDHQKGKQKEKQKDPYSNHQKDYILEDNLIKKNNNINKVMRIESFGPQLTDTNLISKTHPGTQLLTQNMGRQNIIKQQQSRNQQKSQSQHIQLTKSLLLQTKIRDLQHLLVEKQQQLQKMTKLIETNQNQYKTYTDVKAGRDNAQNKANMNNRQMRTDSTLWSTNTKSNKKTQTILEDNTKTNTLSNKNQHLNEQQIRFKQVIKQLQTTLQKMQQSYKIINTSTINPISIMQTAKHLLGQIFQSISTVIQIFNPKDSNTLFKLSIQKDMFIEYFAKSLNMKQHKDIEGQKMKQSLKLFNKKQTSRQQNEKQVKIQQKKKNQLTNKKTSLIKDKQNKQKSFHTPSQSYLNKNQSQYNMESFKDDSNNCSISMVKKSRKTLKQLKQIEKDSKDQQSSSNHVIAGVIVEENQVQNVLLRQQQQAQKSKKQEEKLKETDNKQNPKTNIILDPSVHQRQKAIQKNQLKNNSKKVSNNKQQDSNLEISSQIDISSNLQESESSLTQKFMKKHPNILKNNMNQQNQSGNDNDDNDGQQNVGQITSISQSLLEDEYIKKSRTQSGRGKQNLPLIRVMQSPQKIQKGQQNKNSVKRQQHISKPQILSTFPKPQDIMTTNNNIKKQSLIKNLQLSSSSSSSSSSSTFIQEIKANNKMQQKQQNFYSSQQYMQLFKKYKAIQACLLMESERNNKREIEYQSYLKQIKMKLNPYSKLTLQQRLYESQKRIKQLQKQVKQQQNQFIKQIKTHIQQSEKLSKQYLVLLQKKSLQKQNN